MADEDQAPAEPIFRANKRRKVFRKRGDSTEDDNSENETGVTERTTTQSVGSNYVDGHIPSTITGPTTQVRRPKKHGIAFSSSGPGPRQPRDELAETALSVAAPQTPEAVQQQNERFIKPTGKAVVTDDKHMYVVPLKARPKTRSEQR